MQEYNTDNYCFVCGPANPIGLKLKFTIDEETGETVSRIKFADHFQGWQGVLHGGLISTVLDEVMFYANHQKTKKKSVTAELNVRFKKPARMEKEFTIKGKVVDIRKRLVFTEGSLVDSDNNVVATATGKFLQVD
jgi:uncharacterized protein (TIGR00369 family)